MISQHTRRTPRFFYPFLLFVGFLVTGCGSRSTSLADAEVTDLDDTPVTNPVDAPIPLPSGTPVPLPTPQSDWQSMPQHESFGQFNNLMRRCRPHMGGQKDKIIKWLLAILEGTSFGQQTYGSYNTGIPTIYYDSRGFSPSSRGGACMKGLKKRMERFREWEDEGYYPSGTISQWIPHSTDWSYGQANQGTNYGYDGYYGNAYNYGSNGGYQSGYNGYPYGYSMGQ